MMSSLCFAFRYSWVTRMIKKLQEYWLKTVILFSIGLVISLLIRRNLNSAGGMFISDMFFIIAMVFIVTAIWELVSNMGLFNSMVFGAKCFYRIFRKTIKPSTQVKEEYIEYVQGRRKFGSVPLLLLIGMGFLGISILPVLLGNIFSASQ